MSDEKKSSFNDDNGPKTNEFGEVQGTPILNFCKAAAKRKKAKNKIAYNPDTSVPLELHEIIQKLVDPLLGKPEEIGFKAPDFLYEDGILAKRIVLLDDEFSLYDIRDNTIEEIPAEILKTLPERIIEDAIQYAAANNYHVYLEALRNSGQVQKEFLYRLETRACGEGNSYFRDIAPVAQKSDRFPARQRLAYDIKPLGWEEALKKMPALSAWLGRTDDPQAIAQLAYESISGLGNSKQALWLWGPPDAGKSTFSEVMAETLGAHACVTIPSWKFGDEYRWLISEIYRSILVTVDDASPKLCKGNIWKSVTGTRRHLMDVKFKASQKVELKCRFICTSNFLPETDLGCEYNLEAQNSRLVIVRIDKLDSPPTGQAWKAWKKDMAGEIRWLFSAGMKLYEDGYLESKRINRIKAQIADQVANSKEHDFLHQFEFCKGARLFNKDLRKFIFSHTTLQTKDFSTLRLVLIRHFNTHDSVIRGERYVADVKLR